MRLAGIASLSQQENVSSIELLESKLLLWQQAIKLLKNIPQESSKTPLIKKKLIEYEKNLAWIKYQIESKKSKWIEEIINEYSIPKDRVMITVCNLDSKCRNFQGNKKIINPASLIKIPIAIAVMKKIQIDKVDLNTQILVNKGNFTEDVSDIIVGNKYTLRRLLFRMINQSSNIATNQLIDYAGRKQLNENLNKLGYINTYIGYKLVGEKTFPSNPGCCYNHITTSELTKMMLKIYNLKDSKYYELSEFLARQKDRTMGYTSLKKQSISWLGEKTGRHSQFKGTTIATKINDEIYVISVAITQGVNDKIIGDITAKIAKYISTEDELSSL